MSKIKKLVLSAMFLAVGMVLPFFTGQIQTIGNMLCPMHLPVMLCSLICGWRYGLAVGVVLPLLRSLLFAMPPLYPVALAMTFELASYGFFTGFLFSVARWQCLRSLYRCLVAAMLAGRIVWGIAEICLLGLGKTGFTFSAFVTAGFINAVPGIILQLIFIPSVMLALDKTHLVPFKKAEACCETK